MRFGQRGRIDAVHGIEAALDKPLLVILAIGAPRPAQDKQFDFVGGVT
jgi:hypothetical protein